MRKILVAIILLSSFASCASFDQSAGRKKMRKLNMYMNDHPDRNRVKL
ncbi:MAG: hypothetical protein KDC79_05205 [Cyclobacteriaceae bacterium]|nr:hypothetical protein [Cyclobacteriaceae bacterium]